MSDSVGDQAAGSGGNIFPLPTLPAIFSDGVLNTSLSGATVKFYLARNDPPLEGQGTNTHPVAQVIMPTAAFIQTVLFFQAALDDFVRLNPTLQGMVDDMRKLMEESENG